MKHILLSVLISLFIGFTATAQVVVLEEDFEDQDLTQNPEWTGDLDDFTFVQENGNTLLQLDTESDPSRTQIRTVSTTAYGAWEFFFRQPTYSSLNRIYVFLTADREDLNRLDGSQVNGYAIHTGNGRVDLVRVDGGNDNIILSADTDLENNTGYQVRVERNENNEWQLFVSEGYGSEPVADSGTVTDDTYTDSSYFGFFLRYSAGNVSSYFLDNIIIESSEDFAVTGAFFSSPQSIDLSFNFAIEENSVQTENFTITQAGQPQQAELITNTVIRLSWPDAFDDGDYTLTISNVEDIFGNVIEPDTQVELTFENPFRLSEIEVIDKTLLMLQFTEAVADNDVVPASFEVNGLQPDEAVQPEDGQIELTFDGSLPSGEQLLSIAVIEGVSGFTLPEDDRTAEFFIEPFTALEAEAVTSREVEILFNYEVDETTLNTSNFIEEELGNPESVSLISDTVVEISFNEDFEDGNYTLIINNVADIYGEVIAADTEVGFTFEVPFRLVELRLIDESQLELEFTEEVVSGDIITDSFEVDGINPSSATQTTAGIVSLEFADPFESGIYTLEIAPIQSVNNWTLPERDRSPVFVITEVAEPGDIVINEFFYRVPIEWRTDEFDRPRYIELYNNSDKIISLSNWTFNNEVFAGNSSLAIEPDQLVVITRGEPVFIERFGDRGYHEADDFPTLPLTTQSEIVLRDQDGITVDSLFYTASGWGGNGVALERRDPNAPSHFVENWGESPNPLLGTPGEPNEVEPDTEPPLWESLSFLSNTEFLLTFDERLDDEAAASAASYTVSPAIEITEVFHDVNEVRLVLAQELINNQVYDVTIEGISDIFGNTIQEQTKSVEFLEFSDPEPQELVINEILFRRLTSDSHQFIEIFNRTDENFDLSGWTLSDRTGSATIPSGTALAANDYIVFTGDESFAATSESIIRVPGFRSYNTTTSDAVILRDQNGVTMDSLTYQPAWAGTEPGVSLERKDPGAISIDPANWAPSTAEGGSTPAAQNSVFEIDETAPEIIFANLSHPDSVEVHFTEFVNLGQAVPKQAHSSVNTRFLIDGLEVGIVKYDPLQANRIVLDGSALQGGEELDLLIENFEDFQGNVNTGQSQPVAQPASPGDLVFNEIMFNPLADPRDNIPDQTEYLEIINRRPYAISMEGMFIHDEPDENNQVSSIVPVSSSMKWIPADGYFLLYPENTTDQFTESKIAIFFDLDEELEPHTFRFDRTTLSLPNAGRQVYLADSTRTTIDMVDYSPDWHNPNLIDTRGIALERIDPDANTNDASNWGSSTRTEGGTPLARNSIFQVPTTQPDDTGIVLEPNPFSPDGDGHEDNLFINYKFDEPDYLLRVRIYDRYGRLVRNLAEAHPAGFEGSLIWDGRTDDGLQNRIGIYIVYIEAYNSASGRNRNFRETVVIARQF